MPKRKKTPTEDKGTANPYRPTLLSMHERWEPEQIADAISTLDYDNQFSERLVLLLATRPQKRALAVKLAQLPITVRPEPTPEDTMGTCQVCRKNPAEQVIADPADDERAFRVCTGCGTKIIAKFSRSEPAPTPEPPA
jgi:hypothetical protein